MILFFSIDMDRTSSRGLQMECFHIACVFKAGASSARLPVKFKGEGNLKGQYNN